MTSKSPSAPQVDPSGGEPFWRRKSLEEMTPDEWESLCDGCGRCCLNKLQDEETGEIAWTAVACRLLDTDSCRCTDYAHRTDLVPDCIPLDAEAVRTLSWLPPTCAYRLVAEGRDLYWWHPLISRDPETVHAAGISVRDRAISESFVPISIWEDFLVDWPAEEPADER
jgi:uncharacterized cysteine cluster protein YcgN (CxxCxxCC family)